MSEVNTSSNSIKGSKSCKLITKHVFISLIFIQPGKIKKFLMMYCNKSVYFVSVQICFNPFGNAIPHFYYICAQINCCNLPTLVKRIVISFKTPTLIPLAEYSLPIFVLKFCFVLFMTSASRSCTLLDSCEDTSILY